MIYLIKGQSVTRLVQQKEKFKYKLNLPTTTFISKKYYKFE